MSTSRTRTEFLSAPGQSNPDGSKTNNIEIQFKLSGADPSCYIDIKRTRTGTSGFNGNCTPFVDVDDDSHDNDEQNNPDANGDVFVEDRPGIGPPGATTPEGTTYKQCVNFTESACKDGMMIPGSEVEWHSKLAVTLMGGMWVCDNPGSIGTGHVTLLTLQ